jgi:hypothetical protein
MSSGCTLHSKDVCDNCKHAIREFEEESQVPLWTSFRRTLVKPWKYLAYDLLIYVHGSYLFGWTLPVERNHDVEFADAWSDSVEWGLQMG